MHVLKQLHFHNLFPFVTVDRLDKAVWEAFAKYCPLYIVLPWFFVGYDTADCIQFSFRPTGINTPFIDLV